MILSSLFPWSVEETVLLIDTYQKVEAGELERQKAVDSLSIILRNFALKNGNQIDDNYRSRTDIIKHFLEIQGLFEETLSNKSDISPLFIRMVEIYKKFRSVFDNTLQRSLKLFGIKKENNGKSTEKESISFEDYLNNNFDLFETRANILSDLRTIGNYFKKTNVINQSLLNIQDMDILIKMNSIVERSQLFKMLNKSKYDNLLSSWRIFYKFVTGDYKNEQKEDIKKEKEEVSDSNSSNDLSQEQLNNDSIELPNAIKIAHNIDLDLEKTSRLLTEEKNNSSNIKSFSFDQIPDLTFTKVKSYKLFEYEEKVTQWNTFYVSVVRDLCKEHLSIIKQLVNKSITNANRIDFGNDKSYLSMSAPKYIKQDLYVETKLDANTIAKKLLRLLDFCGISRDKLTVYYYSENEKEKPLKINDNTIATIENAGIKAKKIPWSEEETALLIETYQNITSGKIKRSDAIRELSETLRNKAIKQGKEIDDIFRNTNGITMRLLEIQYLFEKTGGFYKTSALYTRMVEMYKNDRNCFDKILQKSYIEFGISNEDNEGHSKKTNNAFEEYLNNKFDNSKITIVLSDLKTIEGYFTKTNIINESLLNIKDKNILLKMNSIVENSRLFNMLSKINHGDLFNSWRIYFEYITNFIEFEPDSDSDSEPEPEPEPELELEANPEPEPIPIPPTSNPKSSIELVNNSTEKRLSDRYPLIYKRIFDLLKEQTNSNKWFNINEIYNAINKIARPATIEEIVDNVSWVINEGNKYRFVSNSHNIPVTIDNPSGVEEPKTGFPINYNDNVVDFNNMKEYQFTKPISCSCFGDDLLIGNSWAKLYVAVISKIYFKYSDYFIPGMSFSDKNGSRMDFCNKFRIQQMVRPVEIGNTFLYLETNLSAKSVVSKIKYVLDLCNIDYKEVVIKYSTSDDIPIPPKPIQIPNINYVKVIEERFPNGYKLLSNVSLKNFKSYYQELIGESIDKVGDEKIRKEISNCGIVFEDKVFTPNQLLNDNDKISLLAYINKSFEEGKTEIYYEALFNEFNDKFLDSKIFDASMLKSYLDFINEGNYFIKKDFISKDIFASINPYDEIKSLLIEIAEPIAVIDICKKLPNLPQDLINKTLNCNSEFVRNEKGVYFFADTLILNSDELEKIANYIENTINFQNYITGYEIYNFIKLKLPSLFEDNVRFTPLGWREALKYKLKNRFDFNGNIISQLGKTLTTPELFSNFVKSKIEFTMDDVVSFADELEANLGSRYLESIYKYAFRINQNKFVNKNQMYFDIEATDIAINRFCKGKYISIKEINEFGSFPDVPFPWTDYMLEQYVDQYSKKFIIIHNGYNRNSIAGAIVRKESNITKLDDLVIDILVNLDLPLNQNVILDYLVKNGYIVTRTFKNINALILKANSLRIMKRKK